MSQNSHDYEFDNADAGASHTYPCEAGALRKGGHVMLKGNPCKVIEITTSKTGKHGHAKCNITGVDIFTSKKYEDMCPSTHNMDVPFVKRVEYQCLDADADTGMVSLLTETGDLKDDLNIATDKDGQPEEGCALMIKLLEDGKDVKVVVLCACGKEKIIEAKEFKP